MKQLWKELGNKGSQHRKPECNSKNANIQRVWFGTSGNCEEFLPIIVYPNFEKPLTLYFGHQMTLKEIEQLIISDNPHLQTGIEFYISDGTKDVMITDKSQNFLHLLQYENLKMKCNNRIISYDFNFGSDALSKEGTEENLILRSYDVNEVNSYLLSHFINNFEEKLKKYKTNPNDRINRQEIDQILKEALETHNHYSMKKLSSLNQMIQDLTEKSAKDIFDIETLQQKINSKSLFTIKLIIAGLIAQFIGLYYVTYYVAGWDLGEPISYLLGIMLEIIAILYFLKRRQDVSQRMLVQMYRNRNQRKLYMQYSTNPEADLKVLLDRIKSLEIKAGLLRP